MTRRYSDFDPERGCGQLIVAGALALVMLVGLAIWWAVTH